MTKVGFVDLLWPTFSVEEEAITTLAKIEVTCVFDPQKEVTCVFDPQKAVIPTFDSIKGSVPAKEVTVEFGEE